MSKTGSERFLSAVQNGVSIRKIIEAFLRGGWKAAALETAKRYWPYVLCAAIAIIMLPVIIVASMPSVLGIGNPSDSGVTEEDISEMYISRMDEILCMPEVSAASGIKAVGQPLSYEQLYSVCLVLTGSNTEIITREYLKERVDESVSYSLTSDGNNTENEIAVIRYLTFGEYMTYKNFSDADKEWAELYLKDLEENKKSPP